MSSDIAIWSHLQRRLHDYRHRSAVELLLGQNYLRKQCDASEYSTAYKQAKLYAINKASTRRDSVDLLLDAFKIYRIEACACLECKVESEASILSMRTDWQNIIKSQPSITGPAC